MLDEHRVLRLKTEGGEEVEVEINWSDHKKVKNSEMLRFRIDGKEYDIKRKELMALMLLVGSADDQKKMMPTRVTNVKKLERMLVFEYKATRDYKKGEVVHIKAPWIDEIPDYEEVLAGNVKKPKRGLTKFIDKVPLSK